MLQESLTYRNSWGSGRVPQATVCRPPVRKTDQRMPGKVVAKRNHSSSLQQKWFLFCVFNRKRCWVLIDFQCILQCIYLCRWGKKMFFFKLRIELPFKIKVGKMLSNCSDNCCKFYTHTWNKILHAAFLKFRTDDQSLHLKAKKAFNALYSWPSQVALVVKNPAANAEDIRDASLIPRSWRSPGGGDGNTLQYYCLENPMDRGAWWATVYGVTKSQTWLSTHACTHTLYSKERYQQLRS